MNNTEPKYLQFPISTKQRRWETRLELMNNYTVHVKTANPSVSLFLCSDSRGAGFGWLVLGQLASAGSQKCKPKDRKSVV